MCWVLSYFIYYVWNCWEKHNYLWYNKPMKKTLKQKLARHTFWNNYRTDFNFNYGYTIITNYLLKWHNIISEGKTDQLAIWVTRSSSGNGLYTCNCTSQTSRATRQKSAIVHIKKQYSKYYMIIPKIHVQ